ncbi:MAG: hypothetical protein WBC44_02960 [Planctomycetaceae bacterium]
MRNVTIMGIEYDRPIDAVDALFFYPGRAITIGGKHLIVSEEEYARIESLDLQPALWSRSTKHGGLMCVPGRHG